MTDRQLEIGRTLPYSLSLLRPILGLSIHHLASLATSLSTSPLVSLPHLSSTLRAIHDLLLEALPLAEDSGIRGRRNSDSGMSSSSRRPLSSTPPSLLGEIVETGQIIAVGKRDLLGAEPSMALWRRITG